MKKMVNIASLDDVEQGNTHYPWPQKAIFSIYGWDGELAHRTECGEAAEFDLSDVLDACMGDCCGRHVFGVRVGGKSAKAALCVAACKHRCLDLQTSGQSCPD